MARLPLLKKGMRNDGPTMKSEASAEEHFTRSTISIHKN